MADFSTWFDGADVINVLKSLKVWPAEDDESPDGSNLQDLFTEQAGISAAAIQDDIERKTGRKPFLVTRTTLAHTTTDGSGRLQLLVPARTIYSVTAGGVAVDSATYWTQPANATLTGQPIEAIQFSSNLYGGGVWTRPNQIVVDADYGYSNTVPPSLWKAGCDMAALYTILAMQGEQDLSSISEDGYSAAYDLVGPIDDKTRLNAIPKRYNEVVNQFVRMAC